MSGRFRVGAALTGIVVLTAAGLIAANGAQADGRSADTPVGAAKLPTADQRMLRVQDQAQSLESELGSRAIGSYLDSTGALVVSVSDEATADLVRQAGAIPKLVRYTAEQLLAVQSELDHVATGSSAGKVRSWYVDPISGTVVVTVPRGTGDPISQRFLRKALANGDKVTLRRSRGVVTTTDEQFGLLGGYQVDKNTGYTCSLGFNATTSEGGRIFLTAGHCTTGKPSFSRNGYIIGNTRSSSFPGNDYGTVSVIEGWDQQGRVERWGATDVQVRGVSDAMVGADLCKSGKSTGWTCGKIVARNVTVNYGNNKVVRGLIQHSACVEAGDSGGANMTGDYAAGITSGAALISGQCLDKHGQSNESYSQPIGEALSASGASLVLG
ncbi:S1 family peptidase [Streptomyces sp. SID13031]|uniref:S1 family peptidase n=1 Tax=Streptomyces sp. SID13031 TaxID=2706046 RepID=UPI0013CD4B22|nr:S1 family peptidase [Streptomyces sp. SID13031]NEA34465.1 S1 family peptidase [Streptomyces sp. SID13031]